jgi:hypothetical protein
VDDASSGSASTTTGAATGGGGSGEAGGNAAGGHGAQGGQGGVVGPGGQGGVAGQGGQGGGACGGAVDAAACYLCCEGVFNVGSQIFETHFGSCGCAPTSCYPDCINGFCGNPVDPDNTCVACVELATAPNGDCGMDAGFQANCLGVSDCSDFLACVAACSP